MKQNNIINGLVLLEPKVFGDNRGFFLESFHKLRYKELGINADFVQDNISRSTKGVLRGLHYQFKFPQGKLVTVIRGEVFDVAVDVRRDSPTFGQYFGVVLSDQNHKQLYISPGFAHGFYVMSEYADFYYKCTDYYHPEDECGVFWDDKDIGIDWPITENPSLSNKDKVLKKLKDIPKDFLPKI